MPTLASGIAASQTLTADNRTGAFTATARAAGVVGTITFNLTNTP